MPLYTDEQLKQIPEFADLQKALQNPEEVVRFTADRGGDPTELAKIAELRNLQELSISLSDVSQLLPRLGGLSNLQSISLQACKIQKFPEAVLGLSHLRSLSIGNNSLQELPEEIGGLVLLERLGLAQNEIRQIPESIGQLRRLNSLALSHNRIEILPETLIELRQLEYLFLDGNQLREIPKAIGSLSSLRNLNLNYNKLRTLPDSIGDLHQLEYLSLESNPFDSLPNALSRFSGIKRFAIEAEKRRLFMDWSYKTSDKPPQVTLTEQSFLVSPGTDLHESLITAIRDEGCSSLEPDIMAAARAAVEIETTVPDDYGRLGSSRLGGFPDLPDASHFPQTDGLYWSFLAQLNLAELAPFNNFLPRSGLLSFFVDSTEAFNGKVLFYQGALENLSTVRHSGAEEMVDSNDDYTAKPHRAKFSSVFSLPHEPPDEIQNDEVRKAYEELAESIDHHINGYTFTQHKSPQQQAADKLGGKPEEWVPLLQLGWDNNVGFCFWDAGTLTFSIHRSDLSCWDFSRVHVSLESS